MKVLPADSVPQATAREALISVFILFNVLALAVVLFPECPVRTTVLPIFQPYLLGTGLFQSKGVFVPNPKRYNVTLHALIVYSNGTAVKWQSTDLRKFDPFTRFKKGRFRRWDDIISNSPPSSRWLHDTAIFIARSVPYDEKNPPVEVELIRHRTEIPLPDAPPAAITSDDPLYRCRVRKEDL